MLCCFHQQLWEMRSYLNLTLFKIVKFRLQQGLADEASLKLLVLLLLSPVCWAYRCVPQHPGLTVKIFTSVYFLFVSLNLWAESMSSGLCEKVALDFVMNRLCFRGLSSLSPDHSGFSVCSWEAVWFLLYAHQCISCPSKIKFHLSHNTSGLQSHGSLWFRRPRF